MRSKAILYVALSVAAGAGLFLLGRVSGARPTAGQAVQHVLQPIEGSRECQPGPWGHVRMYPVSLAYPGDRIQATLPAEPPPDWFVNAGTLEEACLVLTSAGLRSEEVAELRRSASNDVAQGGCWFKPALEWRSALAPARRARLYAILERWPANTEIAQPVRFPLDYPLTAMAKRMLPPDAATLFGQLVYLDCNLQCFADSGIVMQHLKTSEQCKRFIQLLTGITAMMPNLLIDEHDDVEALVRYWGGGGRESDVRTLLECSSLSGGQRAVPISMLLPPFPRTRLFRYRHESDGALPNCHYSALNYFAIQPDQTLQDLATAAQRLLSDYTEITAAELRPGDLVLVRDDHGDVLHSCNYLCDDLVFTKNGGAMAQPWTIQHLGDVVGNFSCHRTVKVTYARMRAANVPQDN